MRNLLNITTIFAYQDIRLLNRPIVVLKFVNFELYKYIHLLVYSLC